jgi:hypothetical protein
MVYIMLIFPIRIIKLLPVIILLLRRKNQQMCDSCEDFKSTLCMILTFRSGNALFTIMTVRFIFMYCRIPYTQVLLVHES